MSTKFKLGIVVPLRARSTTSSWDKVCSNLERTLRSLINQSDADFVATVSGHDCPDFMQGQDPAFEKQISFTEFTDFPPPMDDSDSAKLHMNYEFDRCRKILSGMISLKETSDVTHWYALDADDLIHPSFVSISKKHANADAVIIDYGFSYYEDTDVIHEENEFSTYCGSCTIMPNRHIELPDSVLLDNFRETWFGGIAHNRMRSTLRERGMDVVVPKERLAMYMRNHGANLSDMRKRESLWLRTKFKIKSIVKKPKMLSAVRREFGLE